MKLRLYHHHDGARIAYRETGTGPGLALFHALGLSHRVWQPLVDQLSHSYRLVLPDLPLHGDSEERPRHPYTREWLAELIAAFCHDTLGGRPYVVGHGLGAELLLHACVTRRTVPGRLVLMPSRLHGPYARENRMRTAATAARGLAIPGVDRLVAHAVAAALAPGHGASEGARAAHEMRQAATRAIAGNANLARSWAKLARRWPLQEDPSLLDAYETLDFPVLLLWADTDPEHPIALAQQALARLPNAHLRVLPQTGAMLPFEDPVGVAREIAAFCR